MIRTSGRADGESDDVTTDMSEELPASRENRRRAALSGEGWMEGPDGFWRNVFDNAELMPKCEIGYFTYVVVRDRS